MKCIFGIDVGGTDIKIGKFINEQLVLAETIKTNKDNNGKYILDDIYLKVNEMLANDELVGLGMGVPGPVVGGKVLGCRNLGWGATDLEDILKSQYPGIIIKVINDANAATLGEQKLGGGKGYSSFVLITLGTGIGGGVVLDDKLQIGANGSSGEVGHIRVDFSNIRKCNCGLYDCVEQYSSATGLTRTAIERIPNRETSLDPNNLTSKAIFDEAKKGDELALEIIDDMVERLATALSQIANTINPEAFVIGGGVSKAGDFLIKKLEKRFKELAFFSVCDTKFELATLGNKAGMYGCFYIVKEDM